MSRPSLGSLVPAVLAVLLAAGVGACGDETPEVATTAAPAAEATTESTEVSAQPAAGADVAEDEPVPTPDEATEAMAPSRPVLEAGDFVDVRPAFDLYSENFQSPSGNIQCVVGPGDEGLDPYVQCWVFEADWSVPEESCEVDWIDTEVGLSDLPYAGGCRGDTFLVESPVTLQYGEGWSVGRLTCVSREDGVLCSNSQTDSGFLVSRGRYSIF